MKKIIKAWIMVDTAKSTRPGTIRYGSLRKEDKEYAEECGYNVYPCEISYLIPETNGREKKSF